MGGRALEREAHAAGLFLTSSAFCLRLEPLSSTTKVTAPRGTLRVMGV